MDGNVCPNRIAESRKDILTTSHLVESSTLNIPLVFCNMISHWPASSWKPRHLARLLNGKTVMCRLGCLPCFQESSEIQWEKDSIHHSVSLDDLLDWVYGEAATPTQFLPESISHCSPDQLWAYIDYKYVKDVFAEQPELFKAFDWSPFGVGERDGYQSTLWIGTRGAHTCCHYDTYGFNLVAQLHGRKRWILFPPEDSDKLYPTRIPYEESSVFSEVNIKTPDIGKHPKFKDCHPYVVTLEAGQVLYVPRHWWHFVECLELSISANTWVEMHEDNESRVDEAITRLIFSKWSQDCPQDFRINPKEDLEPEDVNLGYLSQALFMAADSNVKATSIDSSVESSSNISEEESTDNPSHIKLPNHLQNLSNSIWNIVSGKIENLQSQHGITHKNPKNPNLQISPSDQDSKKNFEDTSALVSHTFSKSAELSLEGEQIPKKLKLDVAEKTPCIYKISPSSLEGFLDNLKQRSREKQCRKCHCLKDLHPVSFEEDNNDKTEELLSVNQGTFLKCLLKPDVVSSIGHHLRQYIHHSDYT
ncbi:Hypothetical predicted protein [Octopus vulgaris]|uniref:JmjC domain-containing protein n=1 Tax=Octopus vulgaris TaxID=6645 RepID=A0AA36AP96_OCTVU|nr:Hypothetical predicted protein [Octopus vulgaris]